MKSIKFTYIVITLALLFAGCRKDESIDETITNPSGDPTIEVISGVTGLVRNESGEAIPGAVVSVYNRTISTDENGVFYINNVGLNRSNSNVSVEKEGYFTGYKSFIPTLGMKSFIELRLVERGSPASINTSSGGEIMMNGGARLILPPNSIVEKDGGAAYSGTFNVYTHWYDPTDPDLGLTMPGNLTGIQEGMEVQLGTYGMIAVELESPQGKSLQLAPNSTAQLQFPVPNTLEPPGSIALWSFDEMDGVWVQEGTALLDDGVYQAEVSHFSFWNCDAPFPLVQITGRLVQDGIPLTNLKVSISNDGVGSGYGFTDNNGVFTGKVPRDRELTITITHCGEEVYSGVLGSFVQDTDLGDIDIVLDNFVTIVKGTLLDCSNMPSPEGYGLIRSGEQIEQIVTPRIDGSFEAIVLGCEAGNYSIQFYNPITLNGSEVIQLNGEIEENDLGELRLCDGIDEFIQVFVDGNQTPLYTEGDFYYANGEKIIIRAGESGDLGSSFSLDVFANSAGIYNPSSVQLIDLGQGGEPVLTMFCGDHSSNVYACDQFTVEITEFGDFIAGNFIGTLIARVDSLSQTGIQFETYAVEGSFRLSIDQIVTTGEISGQFWLDLNDNSIREDDEDNEMILQRVQLQRGDGQSTELFPSYLNAYSQSYKFTNLLPGDYKVLVYRTNGYDIVEKNIGSDDRDCDFELVNFRYESDFFAINEEDVYENVDCGFKAPTSVTCGSVTAVGCFPNLQVRLNISGGVPPFKVTMNGEDKGEFYENAVIDVAGEGVYFFNVEDAIGNTCNTEGSIDNYSNTINGIVWRDEEGGTPNKYDIGFDTRLSDIPVFLYDESGALVSGTVSNDGLYRIENVPAGNHYILVDPPSALMVTDQDLLSVDGNDINPDNNQSNVFEVGDCHDKIQVDVGLKPI